MLILFKWVHDDEARLTICQTRIKRYRHIPDKAMIEAVNRLERGEHSSNGQL
jgi:hypothetical protein